ncbi:MAG: hypothetical protein UHP28_05370 [Treponema sp.]|nr:hypothetical protein [Treponema sp.]
MSDSTENTNELDNYGVWIKRPPQDAEESTFDIADTQNETDNMACLGAENEVSLDDFDFPNLNEDSAEENSAEEEVSLDDFIDGDFTDPNPGSPNQTPATEDTSPSEDTEISLDDFMDGDFTDPNPQSPSANDSGEVSLDDFLDEGFSDSSSKKQDDIEEDDPLDIDLAFSEEEIPTEEITEESDSSADEMEDMFDTAVVTTEENTESISMDDLSTTTEEISLDDFGIDENSDDATAVAAGNSVNASAEENVDLSDFGIDSDAEETPVTSNVKESAKNKVVDYNLSITDDDVHEEKNEDNAEQTEEVKTDVEKTSGSNTTSVENSLLQQIINDLSGLKNEIQSLKSDFEVLKTKDTIQPSVEIADEEKIEMPEETESDTNGFFGTDDGDDTIALSGDELNNIMNTADFSTEEAVPQIESIEENNDSETPLCNDFDSFENEILPEDSLPDAEIGSEEEPALTLDESSLEDTFETQIEDTSSLSLDESLNEEIIDSDIPREINEPIIEEQIPQDELKESEESFSEEPDSGLSIDFDNETLEEPNLDELDDSSALPDEISIPKVDSIVSEEDNDILVESSSTDFMDSVKDTTDQFTQTENEEALTAEELSNVLVDVDKSSASEDNMQIEEVIEDFDMENPSEETAEESSEETAEESSEETTEESSDDFETIAEENNVSDNGFAINPLDLDDILPEEKSESDITDESVDYLSEDSTSVLDDEKSIEEENNNAFAKEQYEINSDIPSPVSYDNDTDTGDLPKDLKADVKSVLLYMDQLLENLPEDKIVEFAKSEQFATYKKLFNELGLS